MKNLNICCNWTKPGATSKRGISFETCAAQRWSSDKSDKSGKRFVLNRDLNLNLRCSDDCGMDTTPKDTIPNGCNSE